MYNIDRRKESRINMTIVSYLKKHGGYARMKELKKSSIYARDIAKLLDQGVIEKVKPGLYRLAKIETIKPEFNEPGKLPSASIIDVCHAMPEGVICLASALEFYGLTTFNPSEVNVAIPNSAKPPKILYPPVKIFYFRERFYKPGIEQIKTQAGIVKIYNREKTICDMFRYRKKIGEDIALEGLKNYLKLEDANINKLREYAEICQVKTVMMPYLKALVG